MRSVNAVSRIMSKKMDEVIKSSLCHVKCVTHINELEAEKEKLEVYLKSLIAENEALTQQLNKSKKDAKANKMNESVPEGSVRGKDSRREWRKGSGQEVYERLSQCSMPLKSEYYKAQKEARESQYCTFKPELPRARRNSGDTRNAHERLHREAEAIEQSRKLKLLALTSKEVDGCTFTPWINERGRGCNTSKFEKLYSDHERNKKKLAEKELLRDQEEIERCTFKPSLARRQQESADSEVPRYEQLYVRHGQKLQLLEQKRKEIAQEEKRMREFIAKDIKNAPPSHDNTFERLYNMSKVYLENKKALEKRVMKEEGVTFSPKITAKASIHNSKQSTKRNESFALNKENKNAAEAKRRNKGKSNSFFTLNNH